MNHKYKSLECDPYEHVLRNDASSCSTSNSMYLLKMAALLASQSAFSLKVEDGDLRGKLFNSTSKIEVEMGGKIAKHDSYGMILCGEVYFMVL